MHTKHTKSTLCVVILILCSLFIAMVYCTTATQRDTKTTGSRSRGYIQDLIDAASWGDTITIPTGMYYGPIVIDKRLTLLGEDRETTIIDGQGEDIVIRITDAAWKVTLQGFTITNSSNSEGVGILVEASYDITIIGNIITGHNGSAIKFNSHIQYHVISDNIITNNGYGILFDINYYISEITIENNIISHNVDGIHFFILDCYLVFVRNNTIAYNTNYGVSFHYPCCVAHLLIYHNNFIENEQHTYSATAQWYQEYGTPFNPLTDGGNYWSDYTGVDEFSGPNQDIPGSDGIGDTPYAIPGGDRIDKYPFIEPWMLPDTTPPDIIHDTVGYAFYNEEFIIDAQIVDDRSEPGTITAYIQNHQPTYTLRGRVWTTIKMQYIGETTYRGVIPKDVINQLYALVHQPAMLLFSFRIIAVDEAGNEQVTGIYTVRIVRDINDIPIEIE
ncbi:MAG: right-handed parallel beta-helix repeat-containing protein [Candidatus Thermoplasmatota archaeon]|nr:right-handed parallel beta-helix repeat-containing protein [Candidatus Thermoplasmatota archaeon]